MIKKRTFEKCDAGHRHWLANRVVDGGQLTDKIRARFSLVLSLVRAGIVFLFFSYQAHAEDDKSHMFNSVNQEVHCMTGKTQDKYLKTQKVDINLARALCQDAAKKKTPIYNGFVVDPQGQLQSKNFYDCDIFTAAVNSAYGIKPAVCDQKPHKTGFQTTKGQLIKNLKQNIALWDNQPDNRRSLTDSEIKEHSGSGHLVYKKITWGDSFAKHPHSVGSAFAVACPDGHHDIVVTNSHAFKNSKNKMRTRWEEGKKAHLIPSDLIFQNTKGITYSLLKAQITLGWKSTGTFQPTISTDWAVVQMPRAFTAHITKAYQMGSASKIKPQQCITMVSWFHPIIQQAPKQYIQNCKIVSTSKISNQKMIRHNCQTQTGSSGAALLDCTTHEVLGLHRGSYIDDEQNQKQFKADNYNRALALEGPFKKAVLDQCKK